MAGRCLAWGFGVEEQVDEERFQDAFMYGVRDLVSTISILDSEGRDTACVARY